MSLNHLSNINTPALYLNPNVGNIKCLSITSGSQSISGSLVINNGELIVNNANSISALTVDAIGTNAIVTTSMSTIDDGSGNSFIGGNQSITKNLLISGNLALSGDISSPQLSSSAGSSNFIGNLSLQNGNINILNNSSVSVLSVSASGTTSQVSGQHNELDNVNGDMSVFRDLTVGRNVLVNGTQILTDPSNFTIKVSQNPNPIPGTGFNLSVFAGDANSANGNGGGLVLQGGSGPSNNGGPATLDSGIGGTTGNVVSIGNTYATSVVLGRSGITTTLNGTQNVPNLTASNLVVTDGSKNLVSGGTLIYPTRDTMWADERFILAGSSPLTLQPDPASMYGYSFQSPAADGDTTTASFFCQAGTYTVSVLLLKNSNEPIINVMVDGISLGTYDMYSAVASYDQVATFPLILANYGRHVLTIVVSGKNGASTGFICPISKSSIALNPDSTLTSPTPL